MVSGGVPARGRSFAWSNRWCYRIRRDGFWVYWPRPCSAQRSYCSSFYDEDECFDTESASYESPIVQITPTSIKGKDREVTNELKAYDELSKMYLIGR